MCKLALPRWKQGNYPVIQIYDANFTDATIGPNRNDQEQGKT